jgi:pimeloyl-ACP methyl ester carboxylesterase
MPRVKAGDINIYYEVHGQGEPLVLIMGLGCSGALWLYQVEEFARKYRVIVFDNRGVGRTDKPAIDYSIEMFADDTANLLRTLGLERAHILGMSMGGMIAQRLAINRPQMVDRLILACTFSQSTPYGDLMMELWRTMAEKAGMETVSRMLLLQSLTPRCFLEKPQVIARLEEIFAAHPQPVDAYLRQNLACQNSSTTQELPQIGARTLVLVGDRDIQTPVGASRFISQSIPGSQQVVLPGCGHGFMWEVPQSFNEAVLSFLQAP